MNLKKYSTLLIGIMFSAYNICGQGTNDNPTKFIQGDSVYVINQHFDSVTLSRSKFSLRYFCKPYNGKKEKYYSTQIAVLDSLEEIKIGKSTSGISFFEPGTGMAVGDNEMYDTAIITNTGHHYLIYENETFKRAQLISKKKDYFELEWTILGARYKEKNLAFSDLPLSIIYFVIFIDINLNDVIDEGEINIVKATFK